MRGVIPILVALLAVVAVPFLFRQPEIDNNSAEDDLIIISPHSEAIRFEFTRAFADYYRKSTGRSVHIDWRLPGGTTEIVRYLNSEYRSLVPKLLDRAIAKALESRDPGGVCQPECPRRCRSGLARRARPVCISEFQRRVRDRFAVRRGQL